MTNRSYRRLARSRYCNYHNESFDMDIVVHHKDLNPTNNNMRNLCPMPKGKHLNMHRRINKARKINETD